MRKDDLFQACRDHCDILRFEFILSKPCQNINNLLDETLNRLRESDLVHIPQVNSTLNDSNGAHFNPSYPTNRFCTQKNRSGQDGWHRRMSLKMMSLTKTDIEQLPKK